ncbi:TadE family protein [Sphingobium sp. AN641]|uniref:TadE/TadG family type IV pilus assembly protein n=1 Tax=Sphingobium sp. AN641 TaxID=3133443 RepID=UPI0030C4D036
MNALRRTLSRLCINRSGMALVEFALSLPFIVIVTMTAAELANFTTTKMRISQLALMVADNASRIGTGTVLSNKTISEKQINDLLAGANLQAGKLGLFADGRVIIRSLQPATVANKYIVKWQRCKGMKSTELGSYFNEDSGSTATERNDDTTLATNPFKVKPPANGAVMFVEIVYSYQPLIGPNFVKIPTIRETAAMTVRDNRDYTGGTKGIYNTEGVTAASCSTFSAT